MYFLWLLYFDDLTWYSKKEWYPLDLLSSPHISSLKSLAISSIPKVQCLFGLGAVTATYSTFAYLSYSLWVLQTLFLFQSALFTFLSDFLLMFGFSFCMFTCVRLCKNLSWSTSRWFTFCLNLKLTIKFIKKKVKQKNVRTHIEIYI